MCDACAAALGSTADGPIQIAQLAVPIAPPAGVPSQGNQSLNGGKGSGTGNEVLDQAIGDAKGVAGMSLLDKMATEIEGITQRALGPQGEVYSLRATRPGDYPNVRSGTTFLNTGDVYKYGETTQPGARYSQADLRRLGLSYETEFRGSQTMTKIVEKLRIYGHVLENGELPPGNRIFR